VLPPDPAWLARDHRRRWGRTILHHPTTKQRLVYTANHVYDPRSRLLHMRLYYQPVDGQGRPRGEEHMLRLCHRQLAPDEVERLLGRAGFRLVEVFGGFDGRPLGGAAPPDEHVYVAVAV